MSRQQAVSKTAKKPDFIAKFQATPDPPKAQALAGMALLPSVNGALVVASYGKALGDLDLGALTESFTEGIDRVNEGDLSRAEAMLFAQASALQSIFMSLARRANSQEYLSGLDPMLRLALKAQSQCRATLETLANIKNPPVVFARQANINNGGQQQVNNGAVSSAVSTGTRHVRDVGTARAGAPASESQSAQIKLLEAEHGKRMDFGAQAAAGRTDSDLAPVGAIDRPTQR